MSRVAKHATKSQRQTCRVLNGNGLRFGSGGKCTLLFTTSVVQFSVCSSDDEGGSMSSEVMEGQMTIAGVQVSGASVTLSAIGKKELQVEGADALRTGDRIKIEAEFVIEDFGVHEKHDKLGFGTESPKLQFIAKPVHPSVKILDVQRRESLDEEWERGHGSPDPLD